jgi:hypothetical protein
MTNNNVPSDQRLTNMGILDNLEAYMDKAEELEKCHYCKAIATYNDIAEIDRTYKIVGVCGCHSFKGLSS